MAYTNVGTSYGYGLVATRTLRRGESLVIAGWRYPVPAICKSGETGDWFRAVKDSLLWNVRGAVQKPEFERHARGDADKASKAGGAAEGERGGDVRA